MKSLLSEINQREREGDMEVNGQEEEEEEKEEEEGDDDDDDEE